MPDASPAPPTEGPDWPAQAADTIVRLVEQVRDKTTGPLEKAARGAVYGVLAGLLGAMLAVLVAITLVRVGDMATTEIFGTHETYLAYALTALLLTVVGLWIWSKRRPRADD